MLCLSNLIGFGNGSESFSMAMNKFLTLDGVLCILGYIFIRNGFASTAQFKIRENETAESNDKNFWFEQFINNTIIFLWNNKPGNHSEYQILKAI